MTTPLVSVITPTHNSREFVPETVESVRNQSVQDWEHILVDDCSSDGTQQILQDFARKDPRIHTVFLSSNVGPARARNEGIQAARGRYIAFLDSDDLWEPEKLSLQLTEMHKQDAAFVYGAYNRLVQGETKSSFIPVPRTIDYKALLNATVIATLTAVYDSEKLGKVFMPHIRKRQDFAMWLKLLRMTNIAHGVQQCVGTLRKRPDSLSSNKLNSMHYTWRVYRECEKLSFPRSAYHFCNYALHALGKTLR